MPEGRDLAEAMAARDIRAEGDDVAEIAAQLEAAADAGVGFSTRTGQGGFTGGAREHDMGMDPTFANTGGWGVPQTTVMNPFAAPVVAAGAGADYVLDKTGLNKTEFEGYPNQRGITAPFAGYPNQTGITEPSNSDRVQAMRAEQQALNDQIEREIAAIEELNRINRLSVEASDVTQPYPSSWSQPDEWGMENVRTGWDQDVLGQPGLPDPNARRNFEIQNPSPLESSRPGPIASHFPSPLDSSRPGPTQRELDIQYPSPLESSIPWSPEYDDEWGMQNVGLSPESISTGPYNQARTASLAFDEYEMPSRQQQGVMRDITQDDYMSTPFMGGPQFDSTMNVGAGFPNVNPNIQVSVSDAMESLKADEEAWRIKQDIAEDDYMGTAQELLDTKSVKEFEDKLSAKTLEKSKRLTKEEKTANVAARREAEKSYVAFRDTLNFQVEMLRSRLATTINTHGKDSKEAKKAKRDVRNKEADLRMWERSDIYIQSYGKVNYGGAGQNLPFVGTALKGLNSIEDYFHSLGKTERRSPQDLLDHMKANPEQYEKSSAEISNAQLVRNMYPFLRKAPIDVAAAAAREPAYLRYLINLNVNKQPIPKSYSSNWKNDISDAWVYG